MISKSFENATKLDSINVVVNNISTFNTSVSAPALSGTFYGDGSRLTGIVGGGGTANALPLSGGTLSSNLTVTGDITATGILYGNGITLNSSLRLNPVSQLGADIFGEAAGDESGVSVSLNSAGDRIAIGAMWNSPTVPLAQAGHVRVYSLSATSNGTAWTQLGLDIDGEAAQDYSGLEVSMNGAGNRVAIGSVYNDGGGTSSGHVRVYSLSATSNGTAWTQLGLDINGQAANEMFGSAISMNSAGDRVAVGAPSSNAASGSVRIYSWNGSVWNKLGTDITAEEVSERLGASVSMNSAGDRVAVGATGNNGNGFDSGCVRVYSWDGSAWYKIGSNIIGEAAADYSGTQVSMNSAGNIVAIGASYNDGNGTDAGHVRVYSFSAGNWTQLGQDIDGEVAGDSSGTGVSINALGDRIAIGAFYNDANGADSGHVRIYVWNGSNWILMGEMDGLTAGDYAGRSVSMNSAGNRVAMGSENSDTTGKINAGCARVYTVSSVSCQLYGEVKAAAVSGKLYGDVEGKTGLFTGSVTAPVGLFTSSVSAPALSGTFYGDGSNLTNLDASAISSGTLNTARLPAIATFTTSASAPAIYGTHYGDGSNLTNLDAGDIVFGTLSAARLPAIATFTTSASAPAIYGTHYGDASNLTETLVQLSATATTSLNLSAGSLFRLPLTNSITTLTVMNVPASPKVVSFVLQSVGDGTARTIAWPVSVKWQNNVAPTITSTSAKIDTYSFLTYDGGTNWYGFVLAQNH